MDLLKTVFGIDVSSRKSNVCIMVNGQKVNDYAISNDMVGFNRLLGDLKQVTKPQIIFEATGVYSRRLQAFLDMHELRYVMMNPLEAKRKTKDDLHQNKTDKLDALYLAKLQSEHPQRLAYVQNKEYQELMANNRIYEQASHDLITTRIDCTKQFSSLSQRLNTYWLIREGKTTGVLLSDSHIQISY